MKDIQYDASIVHNVHDQMIKDIHRLQSENARLKAFIESHYRYLNLDDQEAAKKLLKGDDTCNIHEHKHLLK